MSFDNADSWINDPCILRLAETLSEQTGESIGEVVRVALRERLVRQTRIESRPNNIARPHFLAIAGLVAYSLRRGRIRTRIEKLACHPVNDETWDEILGPWGIELGPERIDWWPYDYRELVGFWRRLERWVESEFGSRCRSISTLLLASGRASSLSCRWTSQLTWRNPPAPSEPEILIPYQSERFPKSCPCAALSPADALPVSWDDIVWAALTVGRPDPSHMFEHGRSSVHEALFRISLVRMAIEQRVGSNRLHRTKAFAALDPTEKGAVTYFLGMVICKIFADKCLSTPWVLHVDVFGDQWKVDVAAGRSRPDLFGQQTGSMNWHVFESKGRSGNIRKSDKLSAKQQAQRVLTIDQARPQLHIGAFSYFRRETLHFYWCDPESGNEDEGSTMCLRLPSGAWGEHYRLVTQIMRTAGEFSPFLRNEKSNIPPFAEIADLDVAVGAHPNIREYLLANSYDQAREEALRIRFDTRKQHREERYRRDGLVVHCGASWREPRNELDHRPS